MRSWQCTSDRDVKENFISVDAKKILKQLEAMPVRLVRRCEHVDSTGGVEDGLGRVPAESGAGQRGGGITAASNAGGDWGRAQWSISAAACWLLIDEVLEW